MPKYDYECTACHHIFELRQGFDSDPVADCPECGKGARRKFQSVPIVFKGSGFYVNDYAKRGSSQGSESKESKAPQDAKSKKKPDSPPKSESKKEPASTKNPKD